MTNTCVDFVIESHERGDELGSLIDVADDLRETLRDMGAVLRVTRGEGSPANIERLGIGSVADPMDAALKFADSWALDVQASESRVTFLLATGGPHIELDILRSESRGVEEVILRRYWASSHDRAWTDDDRALDVVEDFLDLLGY